MNHRTPHSNLRGTRSARAIVQEAQSDTALLAAGLPVRGQRLDAGTSELVDAITPLVDAEFEALIPPLTDEEVGALEESIRREGCRDPLVIWRQTNTLVDGHNRYRICKAFGVPYMTRFLDFDSREDVVLWMVDNQLARRNITAFQRAELALKKKPIIEARAKERQKGGQGGVLLSQNSDEAKPVRTDDTIASEAGVSRDTVRKVEDIVKSAPEQVKKAARNGDISIDRAAKLTKALSRVDAVVRDVALRVAGDEPEKVMILADLYRSQGKEASNCTFDEIAASGGFHFGDDMEQWCDFREATVTEIKAALKSLAKYHIQLKEDQKRAAADAAAADFVVTVEDTYGILHAEALRLMSELPDNTVDMFFTDPPYHKDQTEQFAALAQIAAAKLKPGGLCLTYSGQMHLPQVFDAMRQHLTYWWMFAVQQTGGHLSIWNRQVWNAWKPVIVFAKPYSDGSLPKAPEWTLDIIEGGGRDKRYHEWGQDAGEVTLWIERLTRPGDLIVDPFVGGGAIPVACKLTGRRWLGTEIDSTTALLARKRISEVEVELV